MPTLVTTELCTGCASCANVCPKHAIMMEENHEGFLFPKVDVSICVECGMCEKICPAIHPVPRGNEVPDVYALWSERDRTISSSGGAFSAFARWVLKRGGIVFGAAFDESLCLHHIQVDTIEGLDALRGSKYMQSEIGNTFRDVHAALKGHRWVLFCGTPCQVAGLRAYLGKEYEMLITLDLACHGVPSNRMFQGYLKKLCLELNVSSIKNFGFRRMNGWGKSPSCIDQNDKSHRLFGVDALFSEAFESSAIFRECCYSCPYSSIPRTGDCSIADFWGLGRYGKPFKHDVMKGVSLVIVNTSKGNEVLQGLEDVYFEKRTLEEALIENPNLREASKRNPNREAVVSAFLDPARSLKDINNEFHLVDNSIKATIKNFADRMGLFDIVKRVYNWYKAHR